MPVLYRLYLLLHPLFRQFLSQGYNGSAMANGYNPTTTDFTSV
jgi:hypothetical protein